MGLVLTTTTQIDPAIATFYDRVLLERGRPYLVHDRFPSRRPIKQRSGTQIKFRRYGSLPINVTPLVEGVTPPGKMLSKKDITATLKGYGDFLPLSDFVSLVNQDSILTEITEILGEQAGESIDQVYRDIFVAGTNVYYGGSYADSSIDTRVEVNTAPTASDFRKIREIMVGNKARMIAKRMPAGTGQGTMPTPPSYWCIVSHELQNDLQDMDGWLPAHQYPRQAAYEEEIGALPDANMRFLITQNAKSWNAVGGSTGAGSTYRSSDDSQVNVFAALVFARNCTAVCPLDGMALKSIVKAIGSAGAADPMDQRGSAAWKAYTTGAITNELWLLRGEFAATL